MMTMMTDTHSCVAIDNFNEIVQTAIELPTLEEALAYVCIWGHDRVMEHEQWEILFNIVITKTIKLYLQHHQLSLISLKDTLK